MRPTCCAIYAGVTCLGVLELVRPLKLITVELSKKQLWFFRFGMILLSAPFVLNSFETITTNIAIDGKFTFVKGEHWGYYSYLGKNIVFSGLFLWLGTFGSKVKVGK